LHDPSRVSADAGLDAFVRRRPAHRN
jgi:hypothetical protein